ncbi:MAG: AMIN domain-containing protein [Elainellaceae cyanobacterium]
MKRHLRTGSLGLGLFAGSATAVLVATAAAAQSVAVITDVTIRQATEGIEVILTSDSGTRPQIFTVSRDNTLVADLINTELSLDGSSDFVSNNPAPGIASVTVSQLDANSIRVIVAGETELPVGQVRQTDEAIIFDFATAAIATSDDEPVPVVVDPVQPSAPLPEPPVVAQEPEPVEADIETPNVLVPDPEVRIDGVEVEPGPIASTPPTLPRAIAPPVGDIAVTSIDPSPSTIALGTSEVLPRLVLRDAPVREVLSLLARAAGLNLAFTGDPEAELEADEITISLDIENEPIQDVFNYVLRLSNLDASRFGRTIFAGPRLPNSARQLVVRNLRLNQIDVPSALNFLVGLGAETAVSRQRLVTAVNAVTVGEGADTALTQTETFERIDIETQRIDYEDSVPILRGLQVIGDERTNSVTLVGSPRQIEIAVAQLIPLDIRRRQVAVNVKVIDVDLDAIDRASSSFSFGVDDATFIQEGGIGVINFGDSIPGSAPDDILTDNFGDVTGIVPSFEFGFNNDFFGQLQLAITNSNAKILTDPTLVVQEGQTAQLVLADEVITNVEIETDGTGDDQTQTVTVETEPAGVLLNVEVDRIDDNGFVSLSVAPTVSEPSSTEVVTVEGASIELTLLSERQLTSGQLRLRDGQTIVLSGIIQDTDQVSSTKIPILGDLPIIGALFRRTERTNERSEVIIVMTVNILDDSEGSTFGYSYTPGSADSQELLQR